MPNLEQGRSRTYEGHFISENAKLRPERPILVQRGYIINLSERLHSGPKGVQCRYNEHWSRLSGLRGTRHERPARAHTKHERVHSRVEGARPRSQKVHLSPEAYLKQLVGPISDPNVSF